MTDKSKLPLHVFSVPYAYREALSTHEVFRRLGFKPDDIYFSAARVVSRSDVVTVKLLSVAEVFQVVPLQATIVLKAQGKTFTAPCGRVEGTESEVEQVWRELAQAVVCGAVPEDDLDTMLGESMIFRRIPYVCADLHAKGFMLPSVVPPEEWPS